jgi:transposase
MIPMPAGMRIWVACGATDMRRGFDGLAMMVQEVLKKSPYLCVGRDYVAARSRSAQFAGMRVLAAT